MQHTIELMKNKNQVQQKVVECIKNADLYMYNFEYVDRDKIQSVSYTHLDVYKRQEVHGKCREDIENNVRIFLKQQRENCMRKQEPLIFR